MTAVLRDDEDDRSTPRRHDDPAVSISVRSAVRTRQRALLGYCVLAVPLTVFLCAIPVTAVGEFGWRSVPFLPPMVLAGRWIFRVIRFWLSPWLYALPQAPGMRRSPRSHPAVSGRHERRLRYRSAGDRKRLLRRLGARLLAVVYLVGVGSLILVGMAFSGGGGVVAGLIFGRRIARTYRRLRAYGEQTAEQMLARDPRKPVVFLRAFDDDAADLKVDTRWSVRRNWAENSFVNEEHLEEVMARQMWRFGPVFALGRPGALEHPLGATRSSVSDDCWRAEITTRMEEARLIVLVLGQGRGLAWEIEALARLHHLPKTLVVFPPGRDRAAPLWEEFRQTLDRAGVAVPDVAMDPSHPLVLCLGRSGPTAIFGRRHNEWNYEVAFEVAALAAAAG